LKVSAIFETVIMKLSLSGGFWWFLGVSGGVCAGLWQFPVVCVVLSRGYQVVSADFWSSLVFSEVRNSG